MNTDTKFYQSIAILTLITSFLLLIPLVAMQFSDEVRWTLGDFIFAGVLIFGTGFAYILVTRVLTPHMKDNMIYRVAVGFALFTGLFLIWVNGAVGIIGSEDNPINVLYFGVIATGIIGALLARFRSQGMMFTMSAMAITQALVTTIALVGGYYQSPPSSVIEIISVNGFFITLFVVSALLFRYAEEQQSKTPTPEN